MGVQDKLSGDDFTDFSRHRRGHSGVDIEEGVTKAKRNAAIQDVARISTEDFPSVEELDGTKESLYWLC